MKKRMCKWMAAALLILMNSLCLGACGGNQETVLTVGVYSGSYWNTPNGNCYEILDEAISLFEQSHPGVKVEYVSGIPEGSGFSPEMIRKIMSNAVVVPQFNAYSQARPAMVCPRALSL